MSTTPYSSSAPGRPRPAASAPPTLADRIAAAIESHADAIALDSADAVLTYREFGERVDALADELVSLSAPGEFVGVEALRAPSAVVAVAAALRADRPFVFIDPRDAASSNHAKVAALGVDWIVEASDRPGEPILVPAPSQWRAAADRPGAAEPARIAAAGVAYAIHTSGSTGEPKCVLVRGDPLARVVDDHVEALELGPGSRTLQFARLTFDGCLTEILWALCSGGCLVVLDEAHLAPGPVLAATLASYRITHLKTTPYALTATDPSVVTTLRHVVNGGGACRPAVVSSWSAQAAFHNAYGTTETTVCNLLSAPLTPAECRDAVPLGTVVGDCAVRVEPLRDDAAPAEQATVRGELVVTGPSVALGYLTGQGVRRFVDERGRPEYRTGDVVEHRAGGYYFIERLDRQLKVRGYRLDPGEIEGAACRLDGVEEAVVVAESYEESDPTAADALVCHFQGSATSRELRAHLDSVLDPYKVPSVLNRVDAMPWTRNGKVDRDALRSDRLAGRTEVTGGDTPDVQEELLAFVRGLTGVEDVGVEDNFFAVGGDSASAVVLVNKLKELGWMDAGIRDVLRAEDLGALVACLREV